MDFYLMHRILPVILLLNGVILTHIVVTYPERFKFVETQRKRQETLPMLLGVAIKLVSKNLGFDACSKYFGSIEILRRRQGPLQAIKTFTRENFRCTSSKIAITIALVLALTGMILLYSK